MPWQVSAFADEAADAADQQIAALQRAGLRLVDIRGVEGHNITELPADKAAAVKRKLDAAGIAVNMYGSPIGKIDIADDFRTDADKLRHIGTLCDVLGCRNVRIFSYYNKQNQPMDRWAREALDRLRRLRDLAGELGLVLYHENERHIFGDRLEQTHQIAQQLRDGQTFRTIFDFDNFNQSKDDVWQNWQTLAPFTDAFHLKDSDGKGAHQIVGQGSGKVREILTDAVKRKWQGPLSVEPHLKHSKAVMATGPSGQANQAFADMPAADSFHAACSGALKLLREVGAPLG